MIAAQTIRLIGPDECETLLAGDARQEPHQGMRRRVGGVQVLQRKQDGPGCRQALEDAVFGSRRRGEIGSPLPVRRVNPVVLGRARAKQDRVALFGQGQRLLRKRNAYFVDSLPTDISG